MTVNLGGEVERPAYVGPAGTGASLIRPFWSVTGMWAVACGALAGSQASVERAALLSLLFVLLLVGLGWAAAWQLVAETDWFHPLVTGWPPRRPASLPSLPYTQPQSPAGRLLRGASRLVGWWREAFWPAMGSALAGLVSATALAAVFSLFLFYGGGPAHDDVGLLSAAFVALAGIGLAWRRHGRDWPAGRAAALVALPWLAGHVALGAPAVADMSVGSAALALAFGVAAWGAERLRHGLAGGAWLIDGAQAGVVALLVVAREPLAAGAVGALLLAQMALQPAVGAGADPARAARRTWPWLLAAMLLAALALPAGAP